MEAEIIAENTILIILRAAVVPFVGWRTHGLYWLAALPSPCITSCDQIFVANIGEYLSLEN